MLKRSILWRYKHKDKSMNHRYRSRNLCIDHLSNRIRAKYSKRENLE